MVPDRKHHHFIWFSLETGLEEKREFLHLQLGKIQISALLLTSLRLRKKPEGPAFSQTKKEGREEGREDVSITTAI